MTNASVRLFERCFECNILSVKDWAVSVVAMGLESINFGWYLKKITLLAFAGYIAGVAVILLEHIIGL